MRWPIALIGFVVARCSGGTVTGHRRVEMANATVEILDGYNAGKSELSNLGGTALYRASGSFLSPTAG
jgi:hypothetical protein